MVMATWSFGPAVALCLALVGLAPAARAAETPARAPLGRNAIVLGTHAKIPDWATSIAPLPSIEFISGPVPTGLPDSRSWTKPIACWTWASFTT